MSFSRTARIGVAAALGLVGLSAAAGTALAEPVVPIPDIAPTLSADQDDDDAPSSAEEGPEPDDGDSDDEPTLAGVPLQGLVESVSKAPKGIVPDGGGGY